MSTRFRARNPTIKCHSLWVNLLASRMDDLATEPNELAQRVAFGTPASACRSYKSCAARSISSQNRALGISFLDVIVYCKKSRPPELV